MADLQVKIAGVAFENPLIAASGTFGFGREYQEFYPLSTLGGISCKGITLQERPGNPPPRIAETPSGMLNSVGASVEEITVAVRKYCRKPLIVKLSPNVADIGEIAAAAEAGGADAISLINTLTGMRIDIRTRRPILRNNTGGLSGPAVFPVAVRMVWQAAQRVKVPVIGLGGISTWQDAVEMLLAGASALQIGTVLFTDPYAPIKILDGLNRYLDENHIASVTELTGAVCAY